MSFLIYDLTFLAIFIIFLTIFLIIKRKNVQREGILILYRTKLGLKAIDYIAKKFKTFLNYSEYLVVAVGYGLMVSMLIMLFYIVRLFSVPEFVQRVKIPPLMPLIPYFTSIFKVDYLPFFYFTYWIIVLAVTAVCHEFFHGIFAKARGIKIKSTGFAFLGPFTGAFVEPDEAKVKRLKVKNQLGFLCAGSFANVLVTIIFVLLMWLFSFSAFVPSGAVFNTYTYDAVNVSDISILNENFVIDFDGNLNLTGIDVAGKRYYVTNQTLDAIRSEDLEYVFAYEDTPALKSGLMGVITEIDGEEVRNADDLPKILENKKPGEEVVVKTLLDNSVKEYNIVLTSRPDDATRSYLGVGFIQIESSGFIGKIRSKFAFFRDPNTYYEPKGSGDFTVFIYNLLWWMVLINFSVALVNMLPLGIFDGGRVFFLTILGLTKSEKFARKAFKFSTMLLIFVFLLLTILWFIFR